MVGRMKEGTSPTVNRINPKASKANGLACRTDPQHNKNHLNSPGGTRVLMSTRGPCWAHHSCSWVKPQRKGCKRVSKHGCSIWSRRSCQQGVSIPKFKFGDERSKMNVRSNEKWINKDGITYQRALTQLLDAPTQNIPSKDKVDGWRWKLSIKNSGGPTTQAPGLKWQEDTETKSINPSNWSNWDRSYHQGNSNPKLKFGGEETKTQVRKDMKKMDRD